MTAQNQSAPKLKIKKLLCPISGESRALSSHPDLIVAKGYLGQGVSITPLGSRLLAPCKAKVINISATGHHLTLGAGNGLVIELIVGDINLSNHGVGITPLVKIGDVVISSSVLLELDLPKLKKVSAHHQVAVLVSKGALKATPYHGTLQAQENDVLKLVVKSTG